MTSQPPSYEIAAARVEDIVRRLDSGEAGLRAARETCAAVARTFSCRAEEVFPSSTGIIGVPLPAEKLIAALPEVAASLGSEPSGHLIPSGRALMLLPAQRDEWIDTARATRRNVAS